MLQEGHLLDSLDRARCRAEASWRRFASVRRRRRRRRASPHLDVHLLRLGRLGLCERRGLGLRLCLGLSRRFPRRGDPCQRRLLCLRMGGVWGSLLLLEQALRRRRGLLGFERRLLLGGLGFGRREGRLRLRLRRLLRLALRRRLLKCGMPLRLLGRRRLLLT